MSKFGFGKIADSFNASRKEAAIAIAERSKQYFGDAFDKEALGGEKWTEVARRTEGNKYNQNQVVSGRNKPSGKIFVTDQGDDYQTRKILSGTTGKLKYKTVRANTAITMNGQVTTITNPLPYASANFEGNAYQPARPNMKQTPELTNIQLTILKIITGKIWKAKY
jgi:hypothetical protein